MPDILEIQKKMTSHYYLCLQICGIELLTFS